MATGIIKLDDTGWVALGDSSYYRVKDGVATVGIYLTKSLTTSWQTIYTIPAEYAPKLWNVGLYSSGITQDGVTTSVTIGANGSIKAKRTTGTGNALVACTISYPIN